MVQELGSDRAAVRFELPTDFDPDQHREALRTYVQRTFGADFEIESLDMTARQGTAVRGRAYTEVSHNAASNSKQVRLGANFSKPSDGEKAAAKFEAQHEGFYMTKFEPFLGRATLTKLNDDEARCRGALAVAMGVKPWDVEVRQSVDGGFDVILPKNYVPSKHDQKIDEVATSVVGFDGWYVQIDAKALTARIVPSTPPTFPATIPFPMRKLGRGDLDRCVLGMTLPAPGEDTGEELVIDWTAAAFALIAGLPGSGKTVTLNSVIAQALSMGSQLVIVDDKSKAVDFEWAKPFCRPGGWGCDSLEAAVAALGLVRAEGAKRAKQLKALGLTNWLDMAPHERFTPILVIVDEVSALVVPDPIPKGIPKDHPIVLEAAQTNLARALIQQFMRKIIAELRFVGVRMILSTQVTNANTGVDPGLRTLIGHKVLQGVNQTKSSRSQIFADESLVPYVPENVKAGGNVAKGVGVAHLEADAPCVYKSFYASTSDYQAALLKLGRRENPRPEPTAAQMDAFLPRLEDEGGQGERERGRGVERAPSGRSAVSVAQAMGDTFGQAVHDGSLGDSAYEVANAARRAAATGGGAPARATKKERRDAAEEAGWAARSSDVVVRRAGDVGGVEDAPY